MVAVMSKGFDPAEHLTKQGWKGKGTALKTGGLSRPLAVIQKKTLSGVGKDRDEAVPFWDQIFAATAASLSLPSSTASTPPPASSGNPVPKLGDPRTNKSGSWQTSGSTSGQPRGQSGLSVGVRISRDIARRGLYSRFFKGQDVKEEDLEESEAKIEIMAGPSRLSPIPPSDEVKQEIKIEEVDIQDKVESKEEKRIRRAAKAERKAEKEARKALRADAKLDKMESLGEFRIRIPQVEPVSGEDEAKLKKRKRTKAEMNDNLVDGNVGMKVEDETGNRGKKRSKKRKE